jgi:hypothetical protein
MSTMAGCFTMLRTRILLQDLWTKLWIEDIL